MKDLLKWVSLGIVTGSIVLGLQAGLKHFFPKCVTGDVSTCNYNSPYTKTQELGKKICNSNGFWDDCHPMCK